MRVALITTDSRDHFKEFGSTLPYFGTAPQALLEGFADMPNLEVHVISCIHEPMSSPEKLANNIWYHGLVVSKWGWLKTGYQGCVRAIRKKLAEIRPDIVHGQGTERDCALGAIFSGYPNVITIHGNMRLVCEINYSKPFSFNWLAAKLESFTLPRTDGVICITNYTREAVKDLAPKTWLLPNAVDGSFFNVVSQGSNPPVILCVGAICLRKNQNAWIKALDEISPDRQFDVVFLGHVGGDDYGREFRALIQARARFRYEGFADREALKSWFALSNAVGLPSLEDNCPMVVLEAMAAGVPVMAAEVGGVPDLIQDGQTGFMMNPLDASSMRSTFLKLLDNARDLSAVTEKAKQEAKDRFYPKIVASRHVDIYEEVLKNIRSFSRFEKKGKT